MLWFGFGLGILSPSGTLMYIFKSSDRDKYAVTTSINYIFKFKLAAIDIRYRNDMPLMTGG